MNNSDSDQEVETSADEPSGRFIENDWRLTSSSTTSRLIHTLLKSKTGVNVSFITVYILYNSAAAAAAQDVKKYQ